MIISAAVILSIINVSTTLANGRNITISETKEYDNLISHHLNSNLNKPVLLSGWFSFEPYQFVSANDSKLKGMDIELVKVIANKVGVKIRYEEISWRQNLENLKNGNMDITSGATYAPQREQYAYFSVPYRFEEISLLVSQNADFDIDYNNTAEYLTQLRLQNFRLGVVNGFVFGDPQINQFISDTANNDIISRYEDGDELLQALLNDTIDGFMIDQTVGASTIIETMSSNKVREVKLNIKTPIHIMFSKKTVSPELVESFNREISKFIISPDYKKIIKTYIYPVLLLQTVNSQWFYIMGLIGTIAFALSGIAIAARENASLFTTFLISMLPSIGGGIMRDVIINRDPVSIILTPSYMYYILIIVLIGFATVRLLDYYNKDAEEDNTVKDLWENITVIGDALGQAAFISIGVSMVVITKIEPIALWGPFFVFLTSHGGVILRDLLCKTPRPSSLSKGINAEISILWGLGFSLFLEFNAYDPNPNLINGAVAIVTVGALLTRLSVYYMKVPNITFREVS